MGWLGLDDTDSLNGGCTTEVLFRLLEGLPKNVSFRSPRLVRLWPLAKQRTRGNASVAVELITEDEDELLMHLDQWWKDHIITLKGDLGISDHSERTQYPADPGMIWTSDLISDESFYRSAVSSEIEAPPTQIKSKIFNQLIPSFSANSLFNWVGTNDVIKCFLFFLNLIVKSKSSRVFFIKFGEILIQSHPQV